MNINTKRFDLRVVERQLSKGDIKESEYKSYLKSLPDESANADWVQLNLEEAEIGEATDLDDLESTTSESENIS